MRVLGLDVGDRRIGIALSDALGLTAQPLTVLERARPGADAQAIASVVGGHEVEAVVVGLPLMMDGSQGIQAKKVLAFVETLRRTLRVPVHLLDERLTTVQGSRALLEAGVSRRRRKAAIDQVAAQLILQQYLEMQRRTIST